MAVLAGPAHQAKGFSTVTIRTAARLFNGMRRSQQPWPPATTIVDRMQAVEGVQRTEAALIVHTRQT
ncbi:MAG: hypothetical protein KAX19_00575 [Candidatus Brocadiae bacterium]|nr:hypothetical protein [Candidatus Brocadiia bacterium]